MITFYLTASSFFPSRLPSENPLNHTFAGVLQVRDQPHLSRLGKSENTDFLTQNLGAPGRLPCELAPGNSGARDFAVLSSRRGSFLFFGIQERRGWECGVSAFICLPFAGGLPWLPIHGSNSFLTSCFSFSLTDQKPFGLPWLSPFKGTKPLPGGWRADLENSASRAQPCCVTTPHPWSSLCV